MSELGETNGLNERAALKDGGACVLREEIAVFSSGPTLTSDDVGGGLYSGVGAAAKSGPKEMVRTQVYLTPQQRDFLRSEGHRRGVSMAAAIREMVEEKMRPARGGWEGNSLLESAVEDSSFQSDGRGSVGSDETIYGSYQG